MTTTTTTKLADNATHNHVNNKCLGFRLPKAAKRSLQVGGDHDHDHDHPFNAAVPAPGKFETEQRDVRNPMLFSLSPPLSSTTYNDAQALAPDFDVFAVPADENAKAGRENILRQTFKDLAPCQIAVGIQSLDLGWEHPRAIVFADENTYTSFNLHFNASADTPTFGGINPNSDTKLKGGAASWLRALPNDPNIQIGRRTFGAPYPAGKQLPLGNQVEVDFTRAFTAPPKVLVWICALDFSKSYNWRLRATATDITKDGFILHADTWDNTILYKADVSYVALAQENLPGLQTGSFSTADVRGPGWVNANSGSAKFGKAFEKVPRVVAGLNMFELGCGRGFRVSMSADAGKESVTWSLNAAGDSHLYGASADYLAFDPVSQRLLDLVYDSFANLWCRT